MTAPAEQRLTPVPLPPTDCPILGVSSAIRRAIGLALRFAPTDLPILLVGPTGSGKELFARQIHRWSARPGALVDVNCGALPRDMVESLLFGHRRGAFTGAHTDTQGYFEAAHRGTLFLDELGSLPLEGQAKLLRALDGSEVRRLGETEARPVLTRVIAAAHADLALRVENGALRADLFHRLAGVVIELPALSQRREDVLPLARARAAELGHTLSREAETVLAGHGWPGNVRELRAVVHRAACLGGERELGAESVAEALALSGSRGVHRIRNGEARPQERDQEVIEVCRALGWDVTKASGVLGVSRATLYRMLRRLGVDVPLMRKQADSSQRTTVSLGA